MPKIKSEPDKSICDRIQKLIDKMPRKENGRKYCKSDLGKDVAKIRCVEEDTCIKRVSLIINGRCSIGDYLDQIAEALHSNPDYLLGNTEYSSNNSEFMDFIKKSKKEYDTYLQSTIDILFAKGYEIKESNYKRCKVDDRILTIEEIDLEEINENDLEKYFEITDPSTHQSYIISESKIYKMIDYFIGLLRVEMLDKLLIDSEKRLGDLKEGFLISK